jgi:hypothetical protein
VKEGFHDQILFNFILIDYFMLGKYCEVIKVHEPSTSDPLVIIKGEKLKFEEKKTEFQGWIWCINKNVKGGWVPRNYVKVVGKECEALENYDAIELSVSIGEKFIIEKEESGWFWVSNNEGKTGWVPIENVKLIEDIK